MSEILETAATPLVIQGTHFASSFPAHKLEYRPDIGFVSLAEGGLPDSQACLLGYQPHTDGSRVPARSYSITELDNVPPAERTYARQGQGVGARLYNTPHAVAALAGHVGRVGAYIASIDLERMHIQCGGGGTATPPLLRAAYASMRSLEAGLFRLQPLRAVVDYVHAGYGDAETVMLAEKRSPIVGPIPHRSLLIRSSTVVLRGVGGLVTAAER